MFDPSQFIEKFQEEANERLQRLNECYIKIEMEGASDELFDELMREAHTLKGSARMVGLSKLSHLAHRLEDLFLAIKEGKLAVNDSTSGVVFEILDMMLYLSERGSDEDIDISEIEEDINELLNSDQKKPEKSNTKSSNMEKSKTSENNGEKLQAHELSTIRIKAEQIDETLNLIGELVIYQNKAIERNSELKAFIRDLSILKELWRNISHQLLDSDDPYISEQKRSFESLVSRMADFKAILLEAVEDNLRKETLITKLHENAMEMRMLPASYLFSAFPRAVRDMAKAYGKEIELVIEGEETRIDKSIIEELNDPLVHIIRNAVDHGIETPEERAALGKPEKGKITISAAQEGDSIIIQVSDDGRGIDPDRIRQIAVNKGIISEAEAANLSDEEAIYLIFRPGFTSAEEVTETSGRGVGMDVVKLHIEEKLKGQIEVKTEKNKGTTFTLILPLTLAVIRSLLVEVAGQKFAIPIANIFTTVILRKERVVISGGEKMLKLGDSLIPLVNLGEALGTEGAEKKQNAAVVVTAAGRKIALTVDQLIGEQPIVIKPISEMLRHVRNYSGATIIGNGEIVLILNIAEIVRNLKYVNKKVRTVEEKVEKQQHKPRILVVEDSLTTRELEVNLLRAAGFEVEGAKDGLEAYEMLGRKEFDLVLTDIQMPRMDGIELVRKVRRDKRFKNLPIVIISSLGSEEDKIKGLNAGADAYIAKKDFEKKTLLDVIKQHVR